MGAVDSGTPPHHLILQGVNVSSCSGPNPLHFISSLYSVSKRGINYLVSGMDQGLVVYHWSLLGVTIYYI